MNKPGDGAAVSVVTGTLIQVISAINFYLYSKAARQFAAFHICLERTQRFVLSNTLCENISNCAKRDEIRAELIKVVAHAPMLTLEAINDERMSKSQMKKHTELRKGKTRRARELSSMYIDQVGPVLAQQDGNGRSRG